MTTPRSAYAAVKLNDRIYVAGGSGHQHTSLSTVEFYDPSTEEWKQVSDMNMQRQDFTLVEADGYLYAIGGAECIERYDPRLDIWTVVRIRISLINSVPILYLYFRLSRLFCKRITISSDQPSVYATKYTLLK